MIQIGAVGMGQGYELGNYPSTGCYKAHLEDATADQMLAELERRLAVARLQVVQVDKLERMTSALKEATKEK